MVLIASVDLGSVNYAWCVLDVLSADSYGYKKLSDDVYFKIVEWKLEQLVDTKNGKSIQDLVSIAVGNPDKHYHGMINTWKRLGVEMVVLETQLGENITTKVLSHVLQALVESHLLDCLLMFLNGKETIPWIVKVMENMCMEDPEFTAPDVHDRKGKKKASVYAMDYILKKTELSDHAGWLEAKEKRKLDDISDVFWQAVTATCPLTTNTRKKKNKAIKQKMSMK